MLNLTALWKILEIIGNISCPYLKQDCVRSYTFELAVERNLISPSVDLALITEPIYIPPGRFKPKLKRKVEVVHSCAILLETGELSKTEGLWRISNIQKLSLDRIYSALILKQVHSTSKCVAEEVEASSGIKAHIG